MEGTLDCCYSAEEHILQILQKVKTLINVTRLKRSIKIVLMERQLSKNYSSVENKTKQNIENIRCVLKTSLENADEPKCDLFGENVCTTFEGKGQCEQCEAWWRDHHGWGLNVLWSVRKNPPKHTKRIPPNG